jgi:protein AaeX
MRFAEIDLFGVYVAPISLLMLAAWFVTIGLRRLAVQVGLFRWVWHPALLVFAIYVITLSSLTFVASHVSRVLR